jgi:NAD-dependent SIR2 family protein deacetylase
MSDGSPPAKRARDPDEALVQRAAALLAHGGADGEEEEEEEAAPPRQGEEWRPQVAACAAALRDCDALLIAAGAGMSVDSGLPDYRGKRGWDALFPALAAQGIAYTSVASAPRLCEDPRLFWGWHAHAMGAFGEAQPHAGYGILLKLAQEKPGGYFVFTSNVDEHFARAGFDPARIVECHGSLFVRCCCCCCCC